MFSTTYKINQNICQRLKFVFSLDKYYAIMNSRIILDASDNTAIEHYQSERGKKMKIERKKDKKRRNPT